tara:strand:- start:45 stop:323 length:279 start_codon:yes stop_codon:yes gene_type:complete
MKALIFNNKVVDIKETEFEVHSSMTWVDCDNTVKQGFTYEDGNFVSNLPTDEEIAEAEAQRQAKEDLKASAKAKLIAGEKLTEDEANIMVGL